MVVLPFQARARRGSVNVRKPADDPSDAVGSTLGDHSKIHAFDAAGDGVDQLGIA